jgi:hypothetical protein
MSRICIVVMFFACFLQLHAIHKTVITYKEIVKMNFQDFKPDFEETAKEQREQLAQDQNSDSLLKQFDTNKLIVEQAMDSFYLKKEPTLCRPGGRATLS